MKKRHHSHDKPASHVTSKKLRARRERVEMNRLGLCIRCGAHQMQLTREPALYGLCLLCQVEGMVLNA